MYKLAIKRYLQLFIALALIIPTIIWIRDPYMLFHEKWFDSKRMHDNLRIQNYGLIKYGNFDSIIIGTSMIENTSANEASEKLGTEFANLSISGSSFYERYKMLSFALKQKDIKHIIYSLDFKFNKSDEINNTFNPGLYDDKVSGKFNVYLTSKALKCIFLNHKCDMKDYSLDRPNAWYNIEEHKRRFGGFENWIKYRKEDQQVKEALKKLSSTGDDYTLEYKEYKQIIDNEILPLLQHTEIQHSMIIPPYSLLWWNKRKNYLDEYFKVYVYLINKTAHMDNVKIYWFYDDDFSANIVNYKDLTHYHSSHNSRQIDAIKNGTNIINKRNYNIMFQKFKKKILNFNIEKYLILSRDGAAQ